MHAAVAFLILVVAALACLVGGVFLLAGPGWALITTAAGLLSIAGVLRRGMGA